MQCSPEVRVEGAGILNQNFIHIIKKVGPIITLYTIGKVEYYSIGYFTITFMFFNNVFKIFDKQIQTRFGMKSSLNMIKISSFVKKNNMKILKFFKRISNFTFFSLSSSSLNLKDESQLEIIIL